MPNLSAPDQPNYAETRLFLDEPTVGLDPQTRARMWQDVRSLRDEQQVTIFMTTHYLDEAEYADRIAIIDHGQIMACDSPSALKAAVGADTIELATEDDIAAHRWLKRGGFDVTATNDGLRVQVKNGEHAVPSVVTQAGVTIREIRMRRPTLDDVFMHFTGREIRAEDADPLAEVRKHRAAWRR